MTSGVLARFVQIGLYAFAALMLSAGVLKVLDPAPATLFLTGFTEGAVGKLSALTLIVVFSVCQAAIGATLVTYVDRRWTLAAGLGLAGLLIAVEIAATAAGVAEDCGCFGILAAPGWVSWGGLVLGVICLPLQWASLRTGPGATRPLPWRPWITAGVVVPLAIFGVVEIVTTSQAEPGSTGTSAGGAGDGDGTPEPAKEPNLLLRIEALEDLDGSDKPTLVLVGADDCEHCCVALDKLRPASPVIESDIRVVLVLRQPMRGGVCMGKHVDWTERRIIGSNSWFWLQNSGGPPTFYWMPEKGEHDVITDDDELLTTLKQWRASR